MLICHFLLSVLILGKLRRNLDVYYIVQLEGTSDERKFEWRDLEGSQVLKSKEVAPEKDEVTEKVMRAMRGIK